MGHGTTAVGGALVAGRRGARPSLEAWPEALKRVISSHFKSFQVISGMLLIGIVEIHGPRACFFMESRHFRIFPGSFVWLRE